MTRIFHWFCMWTIDPMSGFDIRLVFTLPPRDSTLQYKRFVHVWNNFPCITSLLVTIYFDKIALKMKWHILWVCPKIPLLKKTVSVLNVDCWRNIQKRISCKAWTNMGLYNAPTDSNVSRSCLLNTLILYFTLTPRLRLTHCI